MRILCILVLTGCGRFGFDALSDGSGSGSQMRGDARPIDVRPLDANLPAGLIGWYPMDDAPANTADVVGGVNGACTGASCPTQTTGHHGGAFLFDGANSCIEVRDLGQLKAGRITIALWARQDIVDNCSAVAKRVDLSTSVLDTWQIQTNTNNQVTLTETDDAANNRNIASANGILVPGRWQHLAATFDGSTFQMYVDGLQVGTFNTAATSMQYDDHSMWIGCDDNSTSFALHWNGALDDLQIYNRALMQTEIQAIASQ